MKKLPYGPVYITKGRFKGRIMYYDDHDRRSAICYAGHPVHFAGCYDVPLRFLREPLIDDLLTRDEAIYKILSNLAIEGEWSLEPAAIHGLWSEKTLISEALYERRVLGEMEQIASDKTIFLCHSSSDNDQEWSL